MLRIFHIFPVCLIIIYSFKVKYNFWQDLQYIFELHEHYFLVTILGVIKVVLVESSSEIIDSNL